MVPILIEAVLPLSTHVRHLFITSLRDHRSANLYTRPITTVYYSVIFNQCPQISGVSNNCSPDCISLYLKLVAAICTSIIRVHTAVETKNSRTLTDRNYDFSSTKIDSMHYKLNHKNQCKKHCSSLPLEVGPLNTVRESAAPAKI